MLETISLVTGNISKSWVNNQIVVDLYNRITHSNEGNTASLKTWMNLIWRWSMKALYKMTHNL